jgi:hypothetical protein
MIPQMVSAYRTRRWFRWSVDVAAVLMLVMVVAAVHTLVGSSPVTTLRRLQQLTSLVGAGQ